MARTKLSYELPPGRLWPNTPSGAPLSIEVFGATGDYASGKTLLGLSIAPGSHPEGHAFSGKARTLYLDFEKSGGTYGGTGCHRVDVPTKLLELKGNNYKPIDVALWFVDLLTEKLKPGQFDIVIADPITDIEAGIVDWVKQHPETFGYTSEQFKKGGGLLWGAVKDYWKQLLLKLSTKCQCFYFTSHLRQVWDGNTPIRGKFEPKGKDTLMELASLYLWLERMPDKEGNVAATPAATVLKQRLSDTLMSETGELQVLPLMPPRIPVATVQTIRQYIANPPNYSKLKADERVVERELSEADKLQMQLAISENQKDIESNRVAILARQEELRRLSMQTATQVTVTKIASDQSAAIKQEKADREKTAAEQLEAEAAAAAAQAEIDRLRAEADAKIAAAQVEGAKLAAASDDESNANRPCEAEIQSAKLLFGMLKLTPDAFKARCGGKVFTGLTRPEAQRVLEWLAKMKDVKDMGEFIRTAKGLAEESWQRLLKDKILAPVGVKSVESLDDANLDSLICVLKNEQAKCVAAQKEAAAKN